MDSTALLTDRYEFTMLDAALVDGTVDRECVFEVFTRRLPPNRRYAVFAGLGRLLDALDGFVFNDEVLAALDDGDVVSPHALAWLAGYQFRGDIFAYHEGELAFPDSPVLTVKASFGDAIVLETLVLSVLNHDTAVASAASRMTAAANGRTLMEFGGRRAHEQAAVAAARAAYVAGFAGTSNLAAGAAYGIPTMGTSAHAFTLLHDDELAAFQAQVAALGTSTTLLVDTYDVTVGIERALVAAGTSLGAIRIDSGDLLARAHAARAQLDAAGATDTKIVVSGDLDEYEIARLVGAPVDAYGAGTAVVTGGGHPTAGFVYKLVARATTPGGDCVPVAKAGGEKATVGGQKRVFRLMNDGVANAEVAVDWADKVPAPMATSGRALQVPVVGGSEVLYTADLDTARDHHRAVMKELPEEALSDGKPYLTLTHADKNGRQTDEDGP